VNLSKFNKKQLTNDFDEVGVKLIRGKSDFSSIDSNKQNITN
jgi:hypothetical protein